VVPGTICLFIVLLSGSYDKGQRYWERGVVRGVITAKIWLGDLALEKILICYGLQ